jgi:hypothetical protein
MTDLMIKQDLGYVVFVDGVSKRSQEIIEDIYRSKETQDLVNFVENNPWHNNENVLTHVETVFANLQTLLSFDFVEDKGLKEQYLRFMDEIIMSSEWMSRKDALLIACALHDLSKGQLRPEGDVVAPGKSYLFVKEDGTTSGKGHEHGSALLAHEMLAKYNLNDIEIMWIVDLVENHDQFSLDYCKQNLQGYDSGEIGDDVIQIKKDQPEKAVELLLHIIADEWGAPISMWKTRYLLNEVLAKNFLG